MHRVDEPPASARTRMSRRTTSWRKTWSPTSRRDPPSDETFRVSLSPQSTNARHSLDVLREYGSVCLAKISRGTKRMSYNNNNYNYNYNYNYRDSQKYEMSSPVSAQSSPRLFPLAPMIDHQIKRNSTEFVQGREFDDFEGVEAIRADIEPIIHTLYESTTGRYQYVVADPITKDAVIIDPVLECNPHSPGITTTAADQILCLVRRHGYRVVRILETHAVQQHPTSAWYLRAQLRDGNGQMPRICTRKAIAGMQRMFARQYQVQDAGWSARFDFFRDGQIFVVGEMKVQCVHLLSQPDWFGFIIGHNLFLGKEVPKEMTGTTAVRPTQQVPPMRTLARFVTGYTFHPQTQNMHEISRPSTAQTEVSQWMHDAVQPRHETSAPHQLVTPRHEPLSPHSPRGSSGMARMRRIMGRQHSAEDWSSVSSRGSSRHSNRRISQLKELA